METLLIILVTASILLLAIVSWTWGLMWARRHETVRARQAYELGKIELEDAVKKLHTLHNSTQAAMQAMQDKVSVHDFALKGMRTK